MISLKTIWILVIFINFILPSNTLENDISLMAAEDIVPPIKFSLFFRALSPQGKSMISQTLPKVFLEEGIQEIVELDLIPSSGMKLVKEQVTCLGGDKECAAHSWIACAIKEFSRQTHYEMVKCFMTNINIEKPEDIFKAMETCATAKQLQTIKDCTSVSGNSLLIGGMEKDKKVGTTWTPYVVINDKTIGTLKSAVNFTDILQAICSNRKENVPAGCKAYTSNSVANNQKSKYLVKLDVNFRAFCPACQWFMSQPLWTLFNTEGFNSIIDLRLNPTAGMTFSSRDDKFTCDGGDPECVGHRWFVCAIKEFPQSSTHLEIIQCIEGDKTHVLYDWEGKLKICTSPQQLNTLRNCYEKDSISLAKDYIKKYEQLDIPWMPYVLLDGVVLGTSESSILLDTLKDAICSAIKLKGSQEPLPPSCSKQAIDKNAPLLLNERLGAKNVKKASFLNEKVENKGIKAPYKLNVKIYWRAFCPACRWSLSDPFAKFALEPSLRDRIEIEAIPGAGMYPNDQGSYSCAYGEVECIGHRWFACAIDSFPQKEDFIPIIKCLEDPKTEGDKGDWTLKISSCTKKEQLVVLTECYKHRSDELIKKHAERSRQQHVPWMPYIIMDGKVIGDAKTGISFADMKAAACAAFSNLSPKNLPSLCEKRQVTSVVEHQLLVKPCGDKKAVSIYEDPPDIGKKDFKIKANKIIANLQNQAQLENRMVSQFKYPFLYFGVGIVLLFGLLKVTRRKTGGKIM